MEFDSPGFKGTPVIALANVTGPHAPKTNVARYGIEATAERDGMLRKVYGIYRDHVAREIEELHNKRSFSLTWAASEARVLFRPLMSESQDSTKVLSQELFDEALKGVPLLVVEKENRRTTMAVSDLSGEKEFWTIDCALFSFAEQLIREAATSVAVGQIISALEVPDAEYPEALIVCGADPNDTIGRYAFGGREVDRIYLHRSQRRLDLRWVEKSTPARWLCPPDTAEVERIARALAEEHYLGSMQGWWPRFWGGERGFISGNRPILIGTGNIEVKNKTSEIAVRALGRLYILPDTSVARILSSCLARYGTERSPEGGSSISVLVSPRSVTL